MKVRKIPLTNMTLSPDISCFFLLLCSFALLVNHSQKESRRKKKKKPLKVLISLLNPGSPQTPVCTAQMLQTCHAELGAVWLENIRCPLKKLCWVRPGVQGMEAKSGSSRRQF